MATTLREGAEIINKGLTNLGYDFQIDTTSNETITAGLETIGSYPPSQLNALMEQMNLVVQQRNYGVMFDASKNEFRNFLVDMLTTGFGIEDVFHEILAGTKTLWDGNGTAAEIAEDLVAYKQGQIDKFFHVDGDSKKFDTTIDTRNYEKVFTPYGVTRFIDTRLANLSWSAEYWLMQVAVEQIKKMIADKNIKLREHHSVNTKIGVDNVVEDFVAVVDGFKTPSTLYNMGVTDKNGYHRDVINMTNSENEVFIITTPEFMARLKVHGYSNAFNLSQYELKGRIIFAPAGTDFGKAENGEDVLAVVVDRRALLIGLKRWLATTFYVANTGWTNHFLNVEILKGYNTIFNAVAITGEGIDDFFSSKGGYVIANLADPSTIETDGISAITPDEFARKDVYINATYVIIKSSFIGEVSINGNKLIAASDNVLDDTRIDIPDGSIVTIDS